jgi:DNA polymerase-3 subunit epsilon/ATP-dependent DNA helicase DinG
LNAAPLEVASLLRDRLFAAPEATILVSATMAIGGSFDYVKQRLGLEDARAEALGSPFDYARAALLYVPNDLPDPTQAGYQASMERAIMDVVRRLRGRTLVLFTSRVHLRTTYQALREPLAAQHITLLAQGIDESSRTRLLEAFRRGSRVVLFGTNAFWEGIDVVGEALSCVMVTRLPFAVPTDPIYAARAEQFDEPFSQYAVPQAVLRLKQGFGRLIRSRTDRGAVVMLDRRLVTRFYGQVFVRSLPPCSVKQGPAARTGLEAAEWLTPATQLTLQAAPG